MSRIIISPQEIEQLRIFIKYCAKEFENVIDEGDRVIYSLGWEVNARYSFDDQWHQAKNLIKQSVYFLEAEYDFIRRAIDEFKDLDEKMSEKFEASLWNWLVENSGYILSGIQAGILAGVFKLGWLEITKDARGIFTIRTKLPNWLRFNLPNWLPDRLRINNPGRMIIKDLLAGMKPALTRIASSNIWEHLAKQSKYALGNIVTIGVNAWDLKDNLQNASSDRERVQAVTKFVCQTVGNIAGTVAGTALGGLAFSATGPGAVIGAFSVGVLGGIAGDIAGEKLGDWLGGAIYDTFASPSRTATGNWAAAT